MVESTSSASLPNAVLHHNEDLEGRESVAEWITPLLTDHYQITMSYAYWKNNRHNEEAVFEAFFRKNPFKGKFTIFGGIEEVIKFVRNFKFKPEHIDYLRTQLTAPNDYFEWLASLDCSKVKLYGVRDGKLVFPREPLVRLEGPLPVIQLLETPILNLINFASLMTTNGARMKWTAGEHIKCIEFGLRRAQGPNGAMTASKYSFLGGFDSTSNVEAGFKFGIPIVGTHAHSFVMSYETEKDLGDNRYLDGVDLLEKALEYRTKLGWTQTQLSELYAFVAYACSFPTKFVALVDSYSTLNSGVKNFTVVYLALHDLGYKGEDQVNTKYGVRLDSGDLRVLAHESKLIFKEAGEKFGKDLSHIKVFASNDINEPLLKQLNKEGHEIDVFGIGTNLVTCQAQPALGMVYKLVEINGVPKIKLSDEKEKTTLPGEKQIIRTYDENGKPIADILCLIDEAQSLIE
jgi:nicotinate phosphoribosyltransferase